MSDTPKKPEQSAGTDQTQEQEKVSDMPPKPLSDQDAQAVKGGTLSSIKYK
jgi:hypothetical protein